MKKASQWFRMVLIFALAWMSSQAVNAATVDDFWRKAGAAGLKEEVESLGGKITNVHEGTVWSADGSLLGMSSVKFYLYWVAGSNTPVLAVPLPFDLTLGTLVQYVFQGDDSLGLGLKGPVVFWVPKGMAELTIGSPMPPEVQNRAVNSGLSNKIPVTSGLNLFGRVNGGFLSGLFTSLKLPDPNNLTVGVSSGKDDASQKDVNRTSVFLAKGTAWNEPFTLAGTSITDASFRVTKEKIKDKDKAKIVPKTIESWGTMFISNAELGISRKPFSVYVSQKRDEKGVPVSQTLAFDTRSASLKDYFLIAGVVSDTLKLPKIKALSQLQKNLPLEMVKIRNDKYQEHKDPGSPPVFDLMMFKGTRDLDKPELIANGAADVFGWTAASMHVKASRQGDNLNIASDAALNKANIGPIETPSASFYLRVSDSEQAMGIKADTKLYGSLDLKASAKGLALEVPPVCPARPVGFKADLTSLSVADFPIRPELADCFGKALELLAEGAEAAYKETEAFVGDVAGDSARTAEELGKNALGTVESLHAQRAAEWGKEIVSYAETRKTTRQAAKLAGEAVDAAAGTIKRLGESISALEGTISSLTADIENLLKDAWAAVSGQLKKKRHDRDVATSQRDDARTQKAAAQARLEEARKIQAQKDLQAANVPSPYVVGKLVNNQEALLGAQTQAIVQPVVKAMMANLPTDMKLAATRKEVLGVKVPVPCPGAAATAKPACTSALPQLIVETRKADRKASDLIKGNEDRGGEWMNDAKKSLISQAVAARLSADTETLLQETVAGLPTMAYDVPVTIEEACDRQYCDNVFDYHGTPKLGSAGWGLNEHSFSANGVVLGAPRPSNKCAVLSYKVNNLGPAYGDKYVLSYSYMDCDKAVSQPWLFFFDPLGFADLKGGMIRFMPPDASAPLCVNSVRDMLQASACPAPTDAAPNFRWRLKAVASTGKPASPAVRTMAPGSRLKVPATADHRLTNLAPLKLN